MACEAWTEFLIARLYDELDSADSGRLSTHLEQCAACREELARLGAARSLLRGAEPDFQASPRVVLLSPRPLRRPLWVFATGFACAVLVLGMGLSAGWALRGAGTNSPVQQVASGLTRAEVESLLKEHGAGLERRLEPAQPAASTPSPTLAEPAVSKKDIEAAFSRLERKLDDRRAADLGYMLDVISASELRSNARIGQTREALRYVALASDPRISAQ
jgi:hypothetical protein